jgi:putative transposase
LIDAIPTNKTLLCSIAGVSRSGYYAWKQATPVRQQRAIDDQKLTEVIRTICKRRIGTYGYRRVTMQLRAHGSTVNHKRVARVMAGYNLQATIRRTNPYKQIMKKTQEHTVAPNLLNRRFTQSEPERVGGTDITYLWVPLLKRFAYLSVVKDFATGEALAYTISPHLTMPIALYTIKKLAERLGKHMQGFLLHSDQGVHYTHPLYQQKLRELGMVQSMSRKANCIDNASTETFFGHMKDELDLTSCHTFQDVQTIITTFMRYHNHERRQWTKKKMTPIAYRDHLLVGRSLA